MTTGPLEVSMRRVFSGSLMSANCGSLLVDDLCGNDLVGVLDLAGLRVALLDLVDHVHARHDLAEYGVLVVKEAGVGEGDEELRVEGVGVLRARCAARTRIVVDAGELG